MLLRKDNAIIREENKGMIEELKLKGYKEISETDLKPKKEEPKAKKKSDA